MKTLGKLYLIPTSISNRPLKEELKDSDLDIVRKLVHFIVETPKIARQHLSGMDMNIQELDMRILDEHSKERDIDFLIEPLLEGSDVGLMSDAGSPGVGDPGSLVIRECHRKGVEIVPLVGPSSILLSLMASGLNGQSFSFQGYLPRESGKRKQRIKQLEKNSLNYNQTQIFIEAPYRNEHIFTDVLTVCNPNTDLCIARDLTGETSYIVTKSISEWKQEKDLSMPSIPTIFLILAQRR